MTIKTFKKAGRASDWAGDRPYLAIRVGRETLYVIADFGPLDSIELISPPQPLKGSQTVPTRAIVGQVGLRHLERLGNANHAQSDPSWNGLSGRGERAFPFHETAYESHPEGMAAKWALHGADQASRKAAADAAAEAAREARRIAAVQS